MNYVPRLVADHVAELLIESPAVGLVGPRQVGKSTLARAIASERGGLYLDLQMASTRTQLTDPAIFLRANADRLIVFDEVQRFPELFSILRPIIDEDRRPGRFLLLGSASPALMRQASESLAGRIFYSELTPLALPETLTAGISMQQHLIVGGYPQPLLQSSGRGRLRWINNYLTAFLTRDLAELGLSTNTAEFERLLSLLAHVHGGLFNASELARSLKITAPTVQRYLDILTGAFLIRTLRPLHGNFKKRITKSPRIYWRDSGLRHGLLGIDSYNGLLLNPALGSSWEGYGIEEVCRAAGEFAKPSFYRTAEGAELDLVLEYGNIKRVAFEFKFSSGPVLAKGTYNAVEDVQPVKTYVVVPEGERYPVGEGIEVVALAEILAHLRSTAV